MSLLNSILSSINEGQGKASIPPTTSSSQKPNPLPRRDNGAISAARPNPQSSATNPSLKPSANIPPKRKAEDAGRDMKAKVLRADTAVNISGPISRSTTNSPAQRQGAAAPPPKPQIPYRGTMGGASKAAAPLSATASKPAASTSSAPATPSLAPKTGYLAILERAKAAQEAAKQSGQIKHKPVEKLTKKDRLRMQAEAAAAQKGKSVKGPSGGVKSRSKSAEPVGQKTGAVKKDRKPVDLGYKGTMRAAPAPLAYTGTMRPSGSAVARKPQPGPSRGQDRYRYASYSDEEDDMEEEEDEYESESDMEAGLDDVDREEEEALRAARREDAEAQREENEAKRAKLERKRKLEQLMAERKKKGSRF